MMRAAAAAASFRDQPLIEFQNSLPRSDKTYRQACEVRIRQFTVHASYTKNICQFAPRNTELRRVM